VGVQDTDRDPDHLTYTMRQAWLEHSARCAERRVWLVLLETLRSPERLQWLIDNGKSWSKRSFHLASREDGKAAAYDAAPITRIDGGTLKIINWNPSTAAWEVYVDTALRLGLECGAKWSQADWSHVQLQRRR
jgi:hypothetical protein